MTDREPRHVVLLTKVPVENPRDGGALRTSAMVRSLEGAGIVVHTVAVRGTAGPCDRLPHASTRRYLRRLRAVVMGLVRSRSVVLLRWFSPHVVRELGDHLEQYPQALVIVDHSHLGIYAGAFDRPFLLSLHNVEAELLRNYAESASGLRSLVAKVEARAMERFEARQLAAAASVVVVSSHDRDRVVQICPDVDVVVAPNGVPETGFDLRGEERSDIVFVAHLGWRPNIDAAVWLVKDVWPRVLERDSNLTLSLVGRSPAREVMDLEAPGVVVHGDVPSIFPHLSTALVATAPLLAAGGTRIKILEALSAGVPVVATSLGALGLEDLPGDVLAVADRAEDFAAAIVEMAGRSQASSECCREAVSAYRWDHTMIPFADEVLKQVSRGE